MQNTEAFVRNVTLRICSSLDINVAVERAFNYMGEHFPLDEMFLDILDPNLGSIRRVACYPPCQGGQKIVALPERLWEWAQKLQEPIFMSSLPSEHLGTEMAEFVKMEDNSDLVLPLKMEGELIGMLVLRARGKRRYREEHARLLQSVLEPFALALANTLAHEEVLHYRDALIEDNRFLKKELQKNTAVNGLIGADTGLYSVMEQVRQVAPLSNKVLLLGETGTGKEVIANAIHTLSLRADQPFVKVNCGAIPESLIDSELFGHEKGAFSGAVSIHKGRFERANGGTIYLDEIGELPLQVQPRLLRVLQNNEIERVGGKNTITLDTRVIAATHQNLEELVQQGKFRKDLWFRLNVFPITIPPLRQRIEDIPFLARYFLQVKSRELGLNKTPSIAPGILQRLMKYHWPGNTRELENLVERELIRSCGGATLTFAGLPIEDKPVKNQRADSLPKKQLRSLDEAISAHIMSALEAAKGKIHGPGGAAEILKINPSTLRNRMNKLEIAYKRTTRG